MAGWTREKATFEIVETGVRHVFDPENEYYPAIAYPESLGELRHIYQDDMTIVDLISNFNKSVILKGGKRYLQYVFPEAVITDRTVFEFLWKDKQL